MDVILLIAMMQLCMLRADTQNPCFAPDSSTGLFSQPETIKVRYDSWSSGQLVTEIAAILMEEKLGYTVERVPLAAGSKTKDIYENAFKDEVDIAFTVWPAGKEDARQQWGDFVKIVNYQYFPTHDGLYMTTGKTNFLLNDAVQDPERRAALTNTPLFESTPEAIATCQNQQAYGHRCGTDGIYRTTACIEMGENCTVQVLAEDPTWTSPDVDILNNTNAPVQVVYVGNQIADAVWTAKTLGHKRLFSWYTPVTDLFGFYFDEFERLNLPPTYDSPPMQMQKVINKNLEKRSLDAYVFAENFEFHEKDFSMLAKMNYIEPIDPVRSAACAWLLENEDTWQDWIGFPSRKEVFFSFCSNDHPCQLGCWVVLFVQLVLGTFLILLGLCPCKRIKFWKAKKLVIPETPEERDRSLNQAIGKSNTVSRFLSKHYRMSTKTQQELFKENIQLAPVFLSHTRTKENFVRSNLDPDLKRPPTAVVPERWVAGLDRKTLYKYLAFSDELNDLFEVSAGIAFLSGALGTLIWLIVEHQRWQFFPAVVEGSFVMVVAQSRLAFGNLISIYKFFPIFMLIGYLNYSVGWWINVLLRGHVIQGGVHNIAVLVGGGLLNCESLAGREFAYKIYRYLNLVHLLTYMSKIPGLKAVKEEDFVTMGLLTRKELQVISPMQNKKRDALFGLLMSTVQQGVTKKILSAGFEIELSRCVCKLRSDCAGFHDNFIRFRPNIFTSVMQVVVDILLFLYAIGTPFTLVEIPGCECFQIWTILAVFLLVFPIITTHSMVKILADPFSNINSAHDIFNFDTLIVSSEQTIFASLRGGFDQAHIREGKGREDTLPPLLIKTKKKTSSRGTVDAMDLRHRPQIN